MTTAAVAATSKSAVGIGAEVPIEALSTGLSPGPGRSEGPQSVARCSGCFTWSGSHFVMRPSALRFGSSVVIHKSSSQSVGMVGRQVPITSEPCSHSLGRDP